MTNATLQDRATGALMGAMIGDALALGPLILAACCCYGAIELLSLGSTVPQQ